MLPTGIGCCKTLFSFDYTNNPLTSIPDEIQLAGPAVLIDYLGRFFAAGPPPACVELPGAFDSKSRELDLDQLGLEAVPPYVFSLGYLQSLSARKNRLAWLAPEISLLRRLTQLNLDTNFLHELPLELCLCPLTELGLLNNPWEHPPAEVICEPFPPICNGTRCRREHVGSVVGGAAARRTKLERKSQMT